ncbi:MAG TPA: TolC family protein, partial [Flavobacteriaceae bacterium]|nr:TolC family protein [Flavobacteriaceae bacterium]
YAVKNADLAIKAAKHKKWETTTMGLPQINASVDYQNFIKQPISLIPAEIFGGPLGEFAEVSFGTKQKVNASATLSQLLFDGSYLVGLQSAKVYLKISELAKIKTEKSIKEVTINAYGNVLLAKESITIIENNLKLINKTIHDTNEIYKNGFAEEQDVEQLQITKAILNNQLNKSKRLLVVAKNMLKITMGIEIKNPIILSDSLENLAVSQNDLKLYNTSFNVENNIDYQISKNSVTAKELFVKLEKSKYLPQLTAFLNYGATANNNDFTFINKDQRWFNSSLFGVSLNVPVFSSFKRNSRVQQAKIALIQEKNNLTQAEEKLKLQVESAKANYQFAIDNFNTNKQSLALAKRIEKKEKIKFFEGVGSSFNLTQAQNQLYLMQQQYLNSIVQIINTKIQLENALNK